MAWSSGTYTRTDGTRSGTTVWTQARDAGVKILAADQDTHDQDLATAINLCLAKDGQNTPTGNLPMGSYKHTGVANATARNEYLALGQMQDAAVVYGTTTGSSSAYVLALSPAITAYASGQTFRFKANHTSDGAVTINVNSVGAKQIRNVHGVQLVAREIIANGIYEIIYDATLDYFVLNNGTRPAAFYESGSLSISANVAATVPFTSTNRVYDDHGLFNSSNQLAPPTGSLIQVVFNFVAVVTSGNTVDGRSQGGAAYGGSANPPAAWTNTGGFGDGNGTQGVVHYVTPVASGQVFTFEVLSNQNTTASWSVYAEVIR